MGTLNTEFDTSVKRIAVVGGGSWATALIKIFSEGDQVKLNWWLRNKKDINHIRRYHSNPRYLGAVKIEPEKVTPYEDLREAIKNADTVMLAVPAAFIIEALGDLTAEDFKGKKIISTIKGMIPKQNILVTQYMEDVFGIPHDAIAVIGGPCHAEEVAMEKQSYLTVASSCNEYAESLADAMKCRFIKTATVDDLYGVEYCAVMKNIIAVACGVAHGLNYGDNFQAVLVSNALQEIKCFLKRAYNIERDLASSAYLGDLLVTTYSQFSRNRTFGNMIGRGYSVKAAQLEMEMIAEGYYASKSIYEINKDLGAEMPITTAVFHIIYERISPYVEFNILKNKLT
ncbi:NAD(P)H-dependent glycerol-3-phosphate dehydrogenase [Sediminitomix flava]|uniref:Glycerol-3-phosphate dehydrogenase n=1 Tax=Sediminitomix flava TaxID=379075 RepID=A0A315ZF67_SEDFL|nr:NAD(P)H-dependent glycerol-3-phosphate dehydrogenase [Sediminitomix flava]PWJ43972.1 glycerol-3-phosphate dehydrogenase (NAD(P)+) [Sediminitomix flava]